MSIYIVPFDINNNYINIDPNKPGVLYDVYYKTKEGPLGFNIDILSNTLFRNVVIDSIWLNNYDENFYNITNDFLNKNTMLSFNGVFFFPSEYLKMEIIKEKERRKTVSKNLILDRHKKKLLEETDSIFNGIYNKLTNKYNSDKIGNLINDNQFAIGAMDSLGARLILKKESIFMDRLLLFCNKLKIPIINVESDREVPAW